MRVRGFLVGIFVSAFCCIVEAPVSKRALFALYKEERVSILAIYSQNLAKMRVFYIGDGLLA